MVELSRLGLCQRSQFLQAIGRYRGMKHQDELAAAQCGDRSEIPDSVVGSREQAGVDDMCAADQQNRVAVG